MSNLFSAFMEIPTKCKINKKLHIPRKIANASDIKNAVSLSEENTNI